MDCMRPFLRDRSTTAEVWHGPMRPHSPLAVLDWKDCSGVLNYRLDCAGGGYVMHPCGFLQIGGNDKRYGVRKKE